MLDPEMVGVRAALRDAMNVLGNQVVPQLGWHVLGEESLPDVFPARSTVGGEPDATGGDRQAQRVGIARIEADRVDRRILVTAAGPPGAAGMVPETTDELPRPAAVLRAEEPARRGSGPEPAV